MSVYLFADSQSLSCAVRFFLCNNTTNVFLLHNIRFHYAQLRIQCQEHLADTKSQNLADTKSHNLAGTNFQNLAGTNFQNLADTKSRNLADTKSHNLIGISSSNIQPGTFHTPAGSSVNLGLYFLLSFPIIKRASRTLAVLAAPKRLLIYDDGNNHKNNFITDRNGEHHVKKYSSDCPGYGWNTV